MYYNYDQVFRLKTINTYLVLEFYTKVTDFKKDGVKVLLGLGGWNDSADDKYSRLVASKKDRSKFIEHLIEFIKKFDFDGIDLNWEYPKCWQVSKDC